MKKTLILFMCVFIFSFFGCSKIVKNGEYKITYEFNGGATTEDYSTSFNKPDDIVLPTPTKEGYVFVGWVSDSIFISEFEKKDYVLTATWIEPTDYETIKETEIFNQKETEYMIYVYRDGCSWCSKIKNDILIYLYKMSLPQYLSSIKLYVLNLNENGVKASIFKKYTGEDSSNANGFYIDDATIYSDMCIPSTPALIKINVSNDVKKATLLASGASSVVKEVNKGLILGETSPQLREKYIVTFDLNYENNEGMSDLYFYSWSAITLPIPERENFIFGGWYDGEQKIVDLESKNYDLKALWVEIVDPPEIDVTETFNQDTSDEYYVCFIKDTSTNLDIIMEAMAKYHSVMGTEIPLYIVNLSNADKDLPSISRSYKGEDGQGSSGRFYIDNVTSWEDLYLAATPCLVSIKNVDGIKVSYYINNGKNIIDYFETVLYR